MPDYLQALLALNGLGLPPVPAPAPSMPLPVAAPPLAAPPQPPPDLPPMAPAPPLDMNFVNQYTGPAPTPPAPLSRGQRIANALIGFGAGVQGYGPQFLQQLQEPQRQYEQQLANYQQRRGAALELATRAQERQQAATQAQANAQADREFNIWLKKTGVTDEIAIQQMRQAFEIQKLREQEQMRLEQEDRKQKAAKEAQRNAIASKLSAQDFAPPTFANEIADSIVFGKPLSPAAEKWRSVKAQKLELEASKVQAQIAKLQGGGVAGPGAKALKAAQEIQSIKDKMIEAEARGDHQTVKQLNTRAKAVVRTAARYPGVEAGFDQSGKWPYVKVQGAALPGVQTAQPTQGQNNDPGDFRRY